MCCANWIAKNKNGHFLYSQLESGTLLVYTDPMQHSNLNNKRSFTACIASRKVQKTFLLLDWKLYRITLDLLTDYHLKNSIFPSLVCCLGSGMDRSEIQNAYSLIDIVDSNGRFWFAHPKWNRMCEYERNQFLIFRSHLYASRFRIYFFIHWSGDSKYVHCTEVVTFVAAVQYLRVLAPMMNG